LSGRRRGRRRAVGPDPIPRAPLSIAAGGNPLAAVPNSMRRRHEVNGLRVATYPPEGLGSTCYGRPPAGGDRELVACTVDGISGVRELAMESSTGRCHCHCDPISTRALCRLDRRDVSRKRASSRCRGRSCWSFFDASRAAPCA